jgi:uncharacterized membrane protein
MDEIGPVDYAIISFPGSKFTGRIAPAIAELVDAGTIRIIDAAFVSRDETGIVAGFELSELDPDVRAGFERAGVEVSGLFNEEDLMAAGEELEPGSSALLLVWENIWARKVATAVRDADGELLDFGRIPHDIVQTAREWALSNTGGE